MSTEKKEPASILTADDRKKIVGRLLEIVDGTDQRLSFRAITKLIELEKQNQMDDSNRTERA